MKFPFPSGDVIFLALFALAPAGAAADSGAEPVPGKSVMIPMRDGARLSTYLFFPPGAGPWPVLYEQRFVNLETAATRRNAAALAAAGYVVAEQNFRGTQHSEGVYCDYRSLGWGPLQDGYDSVEWLAGQPWSTGKIGTFGGSQAGYASNFVAAAHPPHLTAQFIQDGGLDLFRLGFRLGGITRPKRFESAMLLGTRDRAEGWRALELQFEHPNYDDYWREEDCSVHFAEMNVPAVILASWYDFMSVGGVEAFVGRQHHGGPGARGRQKLLIGPWAHGGSRSMSGRVGDLQYPPDSAIDLDREMIHWFDHWLRGQANGAESGPVVRYYVMGAVGEKGAPGNEWRMAEDWPVPAEARAYYLRAGGELSTAAPDAVRGEVQFLSDPEHPGPIPGRIYPAAEDARAYERDPNVRTFSTPILTAPVEWTGKVRAELFISSSARDTDFIARVCDVYPDGRSILIIDSILRARYRDSFEHPSLLEPGRIYPLAFDIGWLSQIFNRGHRIRITIGSTGADFYEPNPNTGERLTIGAPAREVVAHNTVYLNRAHASRIVVPWQARSHDPRN